MSDKQTFIYILFFQDAVEEGTSEPVCGYWDAAQSKWVCFEPKVRREDRIECEADHLTNFAALFVTGVGFIKFYVNPYVFKLMKKLKFCQLLGEKLLINNFT